MSNHFYDRFQENCADLESLEKEYGYQMKSAKKLKGALAAELLKQEINDYFVTNNINDIVVSPINVYIAGSKSEFDLLIVKKDAKSFENLVYRPEGVVSIIECKSSGLFNVNNETSNIAKAINSVGEKYPDITFGYITITENVPVHECRKDGNPTVKHWELTKQYFNEKVNITSAHYAVTLHKGKKLIDPGNDKEFHRFIDFLIKNK